MIIRYKENSKNEEKEKEVKRLNCSTKLGRGGAVIESILSVFRVNFFKKKGEENQKELPAPTKPNPNSKSSLKLKIKTQRNQERRKKRKSIKKEQRALQIKKTA